MTHVEVPIGTVLTVLTGRMLGPNGLAGVQDLLEFLSGGGVWTHEIPDTMQRWAPALAAQFPMLDGFPIPADLDGWMNSGGRVWLSRKVRVIR